MPRRKPDTTSIHRSLSLFRIASRGLFNQFFRIDDARKSSDEALRLLDRFSAVEQVLFDKLVIESESLPLASTNYGDLQPLIQVHLRGIDRAPIMLNRGVNSGSWDYPIREVTREPVLLFVQFFDWDVLAYRDNQYVVAEVWDWPSHPETAGKRALIEFQYVQFSKLHAPA